MASQKVDIQKLRLPAILLLTLLVPLFFGDLVSYESKAALYAISLSLKSVLLFIIPFLIFCFLFSCLLALESGVLTFIFMLIGCVFISNFTAICTGFFVGSSVLSHVHLSTQNPIDPALALKPLWQLNIPRLITNEFALATSFIFGIFFSIVRNKAVDSLARKLNRFANFFLRNLFIPILPFFIIGFVFKLEHDQFLEKIFRIYGPVFFLVIGMQVTYLSLLYLVAANFNFSRFITYIKNIVPAAITGFSTVSSAATMPVLVLCTEKNLNNSSMAKTIVPATVNIHTLGSALGLTILALATLLTFDMGVPTTPEFLRFAFFYAIAKFAVAAVPGGVIIVVSPLLETYLGFNSEMIGLITAIYMLFDPFGTAANVTGNGVFAIIFSKLYKFKTVEQPVLETEIEVRAEPGSRRLS